MTEENLGEVSLKVSPPEKNENSLWEIFRFVLITAIIVLPIRFYVAQPFIVSGPSMDPTFANGQYLIVDEISYRFTEPKRGEVIVFKHPVETGKVLIKRIVGLPEETLEFEGTKLIIKNKKNPNGFEWDQSFVKNKKQEQKMTVILEKGEYYALGDNRPVSYDSRSWGGLPRKLIIGRPIIRLWPLSTIDVWPGDEK